MSETRPSMLRSCKVWLESRNLRFVPMTVILRYCQSTTARCAAEI